jgi:hypothetical protein
VKGVHGRLDILVNNAGDVVASTTVAGGGRSHSSLDCSRIVPGLVGVQKVTVR